MSARSPNRRPPRTVPLVVAAALLLPAPYPGGRDAAAQAPAPTVSVGEGMVPHAGGASPMRVAPVPVARPGDPVPSAWSERNGFLSSSRWWIDPARADALSTMRVDEDDARIEWAVAADDDEATDDEREGLLASKREALLGGPLVLAPRVDASVPEGAAATAPRGPWRIVARITEIWNPNRILNFLLALLPWPMAPFYTQGGAAAELEIVDTERAVTVARIECRRYAGIFQFYNAFRRIAHSRSALGECARVFVETLRREPAAVAARGGAEGVRATAAAAAAAPGTVATTSAAAAPAPRTSAAAGRAPGPGAASIVPAVAPAATAPRASVAAAIPTIAVVGR